MTRKPTVGALSPEELEHGRWLFAQACEFMTASAQVDALPPADLPEIAFAGRSNAGKSTAINAITKAGLARTSKTPGRTRLVNFFTVAEDKRIVDLPGLVMPKYQSLYKKNGRLH